LLGRFCEQFSDYAALRYEAFLEKDTTKARYKNDKAHYLSQYDDLSRNRGRAYDYTQPSWGTSNVSGLEMKVAGLTGMRNFTREGICLQIKNCPAPLFYFEIKDYLGQILFKSPAVYPDEKTAFAAFRSFIDALQSHDNYVQTLTAMGNLGYMVRLGQNYIPFSGAFYTQSDLNNSIDNLWHLFGGQAGTQNILETKFAFRLQLLHGNVAIITGQDAGASEVEALAGMDAFIGQISDNKDMNLDLVANPDTPGEYFDVEQIKPTILKLPTEYFWQLPAGQQSTNTWQNQDDALRGFGKAIEDGFVKDFSYIEVKNVGWQLTLRNDNKDVLLQGVQYYPDEKRIRDIVAARVKKIGPTLPDALQVVNVGKNQYQVVLNSPNGLVAVSAITSGQNDAGAIRDQCLAILQNGVSSLKLEKLSAQFYGFNALNPASPQVSYLRSFKVYSTAYEALIVLFGLPIIAVQENNYVLSGDAGNPNYTYLVQNGVDQYAGFLSDIFDNPDERDQIAAASRTYFENWTVPVSILPRPDQYRFEWNDPVTGVLMLSSIGAFDSQDEAAVFFMAAIRRAINIQNYQFDSGDGYAWIADDHGKPLARIGLKTAGKKDLPNTHKKLLDALNPYRYSVVAQEFAVQWKYQLSLGAKDRNGHEIVFESADTFDNLDVAEAAFAAFTSQMAQVKAEPDEQNGKPVISLVTPDGVKSLYSEPFKDAGERDVIMLTIGQWLTWSAGIRNATTPGDLDNPSPFVPSVIPRKQTECYQIIKESAPLAVNPLVNWFIAKEGDCCIFYNRFAWKKYGPNEEAQGLADMKDLCSRPLPSFLEICLDGLDVTVEETDKNCASTYRFALRLMRDYSNCDRVLQKGTVVWQSAPEYETSEDAISAFKVKYLKVLQLASVSPNYKKESCIIFQENEGAGSVISADCADCKPCTSNKGFRIEVPFVIWQAFEDGSGNGKSLAADFLSEAARSYPIFLVVNADEQCGCDCKDPNCPCLESEIPNKTCDETKTPERSKYKFHLYKPGCEPYRIIKNGTVDKLFLPGELWWESANCYDTADDAWKYFEIFLTLLTTPGNCQLIEDCCLPDQKSIAVVETMLVPEASSSGDPNDLNVLYKALKAPGAFHLYFDSLGMPDISPLASGPVVAGCFTFDVVSKDYYFAVHPDIFEDVVAAQTELTLNLNRFLDVLGNQDCSKIILFDKHSFDKPGKFPGLSTYPEVHFFKEEQSDGCFKIQLRYHLKQQKYTVIFETRKAYCPTPCDPADQSGQMTKDLNQAVTDFCNLLKTGSNWITSATDSCGPVSYELVDASKVIARHPRCYASSNDARNALERTKVCLFKETVFLLEHLLIRPDGPIPNTGSPSSSDPSCLLPFNNNITHCYLEWLPKPDDDCLKEPEVQYYIPYTDPYSFWATVVVPCYTPRFCDPAFRQFFEETMRFEAPAHVAFCFRWLSPEQVCMFEEKYHAWLKIKSECPKSDDIYYPVRLSLATCGLIKFLNETTDCPPETSTDLTSCCNCSEPVQTIDSRSRTISDTYEPVCKTLFYHKSERDPGTVPGNGKEQPLGVPASDSPPEQPPLPISEPFTTASEVKVVPPFDASNNEKAIRARLAKYAKALNQVTDGKIMESEDFKYSRHFILSNGSTANLPHFVTNLLNAGTNKAGNLGSVWRELLMNGLAHSLDKTAIESSGQLSKKAGAEIVKALDLMAKSKMKAKMLIDFWDPASLWDLTKAISIETMKNLIYDKLK
jgi:hypothetical protein